MENRQSKRRHSVPPKEKGSEEKKSKGEVVLPIVPITAVTFSDALRRTDVAGGRSETCYTRIAMPTKSILTYSTCHKLVTELRRFPANFRMAACGSPWTFCGIIADYTWKHCWVSAEPTYVPECSTEGLPQNVPRRLHSDLCKVCAVLCGL